MRHCLHALTLFLSFSIGLKPAEAWQINSGVTEPCHERATIDAAKNLLNDNDFLGEFPIPEGRGENWLAVYNMFKKVMRLEAQTSAEKLLFVSLILGTRYTDIEGRSVSDIGSIHRIHDNPKTTYHHCLRSGDDDWKEGDISALEGTREHIEATVKLATSYLDLPLDEQLIKTRFQADFLGKLNVWVWAPAFYFAAASHTVQDSFSHTVRTDGARRILHVMNAVEAATYKYDRTRDGLPHSFKMDQCDDKKVKEIFDMGTKPATLDFFGSVYHDALRGDNLELMVFFEKWMTYKPGCTFATRFCDSKWFDVVTSDPLKPVFSCRSEMVSRTRNKNLLSLLFARIF